MNTQLSTAVDLSRQHRYLDSKETKSNQIQVGLISSIRNYIKSLIEKIVFEYNQPKIYYISINGNNTNDGLSPETPLRDPSTIKIKPGDSIRFKRGEIISCQKIETVLSNDVIFIEAFGSGHNPILQIQSNYIEVEGTSWF